MGKKRKRPGKENRGLPQSPAKRPRIHGAPSAPGCYQHPVLSRYYPRVVTLRQYLLEQLPSSSRARRRRIASLGRQQTSTVKAPFTDEGLDKQDHGSDDNSALVDLLDSTLVGVLKEPNQDITQARQRDFAAFTQSEERSLLCTDTGPTSLQDDIVDFVIATLFNRTGLSYQKPQHLLAHGFQRATARQFMDRNIGAMACSIPGVVFQYPNHHVSTLKKAPWTDVLALLGKSRDEIMIRLLLDCGIFCCLDRNKGTYYQLSGIPLSELEPVDKSPPTPESNQKVSTSDGKASTKPKSNKVDKSTDVLHKPNSIIFVRRRMLYARPVLNARGEVRFGLRHIHVLNRFPSSTDLSHSVHVMKYIFPRQFGLHNVFTSAVDSRETTQPFKDYTLREDEIARRESTKLPKRLRGKALALVQQLQKRHQRCSYTELLRHYCPIEEIGPARLGPEPSQTELSSLMGSDSEQFITQLRLSGHSGPQAQSQQTEATAVPSSMKPCLTDYATPASSVSAFCRAVLRRLIPRAFFGIGEGGESNQRIVMKHVDRFVRMSRYESLSLHEVCKGLKVTCIPWLESPNAPSQATSPDGHKLSLSDLRKRIELLHEFIYYIFDSLLIPLIRSNFYVTESQVHRNRLFYFRHDVWRQLTEKPLADIKSSLFEEIKRDKAHRILARRSLGYSPLRLLPKASGARPIINLRRRVMKTSAGSFQGCKKAFLGPSINSLVTPVFNMLSYEKTRKPELLGSSMQSVSDMYPRLKAFKERIINRAGGGKPQLYFVKLDIQSCFDTIPQPRLLALIEKVVCEATYHVTKHVEVRPPDGYNNSLWPGEESRHGKPIRKFVSKAVAANDILSTPDAASGKRNTVFVDTAVAKRHDADDLLDLLEEHVRNNLVKIGKKYFRQRNGIPQGSVLSALLCNFFYGELEREVLGFLSCDDALLLRLVDDFLLITSRADLARRFLQAMMDGQPAYGISVNASKSLVNFEVTVNGTKIPRLLGSWFPYCGNLIETHTLDIRKDREHGNGAAQVSDMLTVEANRVPGRTFHRKVLASFRLQTHAMFLDTEHNATRVVLSGIYTNFVETAIKMYRYIKTLRPRARPSPGLVVSTIRDLIQFATNLIQSKRREKSAAEIRFQCTITPPQIHYLGAGAFCHILARKQTQFGAVLRFLAQLQRANRPRTDREALLLKRVMREGNAVFDGWRY
ncbi:hypothetical protein VTN96DRAFT_3129 [Rasamsonia emersonii]